MAKSRSSGSFEISQIVDPAENQAPTRPRFARICKSTTKKTVKNDNKMGKKKKKASSENIDACCAAANTNSNKTRPSLSINSSQESNSIERQFSWCASDDPIEHIRWLQRRRDIGLWIECCRKTCRKWRYVQQYQDPINVPRLWFCQMNSDPRFADCSIAEEKVSDAEAEMQIENAYNAGSIVWARLNGYPWWPAMVDDSPDLLRYFDIRGSSLVPFRYNVTFFNEKAAERSWIPLKDLKAFVDYPPGTFPKKTVFSGKDYRQELDDACALARQALPLSIYERLVRFSLVSRLYVASPKPITNNKRREFSFVQLENSRKKNKAEPIDNNVERDTGNETGESVVDTEMQIVPSEPYADSALSADVETNQEEEEEEENVTVFMREPGNKWFVQRGGNSRVPFEPYQAMPPFEDLWKSFDESQSNNGKQSQPIEDDCTTLSLDSDKSLVTCFSSSASFSSSSCSIVAPSFSSLSITCDNDYQETCPLFPALRFDNQLSRSFLDFRSFNEYRSDRSERNLGSPLSSLDPWNDWRDSTNYENNLTRRRYSSSSSTIVSSFDDKSETNNREIELITID